MTDFMNVVRNRRSIRKYEEREIPEEMLEQIFEAVRWAPFLGQYPVLGNRGRPRPGAKEKAPGDPSTQRQSCRRRRRKSADGVGRLRPAQRQWLLQGKSVHPVRRLVPLRSGHRHRKYLSGGPGSRPRNGDRGTFRPRSGRKGAQSTGRCASGGAGSGRIPREIALGAEAQGNTRILAPGALLTASIFYRREDGSGPEHADQGTGHGGGKGAGEDRFESERDDFPPAIRCHGTESADHDAQGARIGKSAHGIGHDHL